MYRLGNHRIYGSLYTSGGTFSFLVATGRSGAGGLRRFRAAPQPSPTRVSFIDFQLGTRGEIVVDPPTTSLCPVPALLTCRTRALVIRTDWVFAASFQLQRTICHRNGFYGPV